MLWLWRPLLQTTPPLQSYGGAYHREAHWVLRSPDLTGPWAAPDPTATPHSCPPGLLWASDTRFLHPVQTPLMFLPLLLEAPSLSSPCPCCYPGQPRVTYSLKQLQYHPRVMTLKYVQPAQGSSWVLERYHPASRRHPPLAGSATTWLMLWVPNRTPPQTALIAPLSPKPGTRGQILGSPWTPLILPISKQTLKPPSLLCLFFFFFSFLASLDFPGPGINQIQAAVSVSA